MEVKRYLAVPAAFALILSTAGCEMFEMAAEVAKDPVVQEKLSTVAENLASGNWVGALLGLVGAVTTGVVTYKRVMKVRDANRAARNEPTGKPATA